MKTPSVPSLERAISILEMIAGSRNGLLLAELVRRTGLPRSSVHCLLLTLVRLGYLYRNSRTRRYLFGLKLFDLANMALSGLPVREQAADFLHKLARKTGLTVHLAILEQNEAVLIDKVEPLGSVKLATWLGKRMDLHCTGVGKALLAFMPDEASARLIRERGLPKHNENTITSYRRLKEQLEHARLLGFAVDDEEDEIGTRCVGAPVFDAEGQVVAAVSISGRVAQIDRTKIPALATQLLATTQLLSRSLSRINALDAEITPNSNGLRAD